MKAMNGAGTRLLQTIRDFTVAQRTIAIIGVGVLVLGGIALANWLGKPTYSPLYSGLSSSDASGVVAQLQKDKVDYQLSPDGTTILVPADQVAPERLAAAAAGLPSNSTSGYSLLDKMGVTTSEFQQNVTYKRAIEGELAKTIESINGVSLASVQLAIPQQTVFTSQQQDPTASVFVNVSTPLTTDQVAAVVHLVAAAYPGLTDSNVSVVDQKGETLSAVGGSTTGSAAEQASSYEASTRAKVQSMLDTLVGPGNSTVTVAADISSSSGTTKSTTYTTPTQAPALSESSSSSTYAGDGTGASSGVLGTDTTTTGATTTGGTTKTTGSTTSPTYGQKQEVKNNALDTTTTESTIVPGTLNRQTIAVAINAAVGGVSTSQIRQLVSTAAGVNPTRGDTVQVASMTFSTAAAASAKAALAVSAKAQSADGMSRIISSAILVVGGLLGFVLVMLVLRKLFRRDPGAVQAGRMTVVPSAGPVDPTAGGIAPTAQLGGMNPPTMQYSAAPVRPSPAAPAELTNFERLQADVDALAGADPERTADYLRALMAEGGARMIADAVQTRQLSGVQKAALVLMNMSTDRAAAVLRSFAPEEAEEITAEMARVREIDGRDAEVAIREFQATASVPAAAQVRTGLDVATELIEASFEGERAADLLERIAAPGSSASFEFLDDLDPARVVGLLEHDPADVVGFVLVQLGPDLAAKILMQHEESRRLDIAQAIATMGSPAPEAGGIVADVLRRRAKVPVTQTFVEDEDSAEAVPVLRVQPLVDIMNHAEPADEGALLAGLRDRDSRLADEVRAKLLSFDDVPKLQDRDLQQVLRGVDIGQLALALKGASDEVAEAIKSNMSERNRETLAEETAELGRVTKKSVDEARNLVVRAIRELAGTGGLELKQAAPEPGAESETPIEESAEPEEEYVD